MKGFAIDGKDAPKSNAEQVYGYAYSMAILAGADCALATSFGKTQFDAVVEAEVDAAFAERLGQAPDAGLAGVLAAGADHFDAWLLAELLGVNVDDLFKRGDDTFEKEFADAIADGTSVGQFLREYWDREIRFWDCASA